MVFFGKITLSSIRLHFIKIEIFSSGALVMPKTSVLFRLSFLSMIFLVIAFVFSGDTSSQSKSDPEVEKQPEQTGAAEQPAADTPHNLVGAYYTLENGTDARLLLNNKGNIQLEVQPVLYNLQGQELSLPPVTVESQSFRFINLQDWASLGGESFRSGNIKLFHVGKDLVLGSQIYLTQEASSLSFEEKLAELGKFDSRRQEAVWATPSPQAKASLVLTNTTNAPLSVTAKLAKHPQTVGSPQVFQLGAHETKILDLQQDFVDGNQFSNAPVVGLSLAHSAAKDALLARIMLDDAAKGFSNIVQFSNPQGGKSSEYQGVGFQIEDIDELKFNPTIVARNVGNADSTVTIRVPYTRIDGTRGTIVLPPKQLSGGELAAINTQNIVTRVRQEQIKVASLEVEYSTAPGSVIVAAHSVSKDGSQVFRVPMWDPLGQRSPTGGYPWRIEGTSVTETYIKNISDLEQDYVAFLLWENGGIYMLGLKPIAARETIHIDVKRLRDEQIPDEQGRTIPPAVSSGQLQWTLRRKDNLPGDDVRANLSLIGRSEQVDITKGIINNYACQNCCAGSYSTGYVTPGDGTTEVNNNVQYQAYETGMTCYNEPYSFQITPTWSSSNQSVATISGSGLAAAQGVGETQIKAKWYVWRYFESYPCGPGGGFLSEGGEDAADCQTEVTGTKTEVTGTKSVETTSNIAPCGTCVGTNSQISATSNLTVKARVQKIQYQEPGTSNYIDITNTIYVLKGTTVNFKAIPLPNNATFPSGQPTWSGSSGVTGTGQTKSVTFNTKSNNTTDYKTVIASVVSPVVVNVIVYELTGAINPQDYFYGRSTDRFGLLEKVNLGFLASPSLTTQQIGTLRWSIQQGFGSVTNDTNLNGAGIFTADRNAGSVRLALNIENGPSKGVGFLSDLLSVIAPSDAYIIKNPAVDVLHCQNYSSVGFQGFVYLLPKDVSFSNLYFQEDGGTIQAQGYYQNQNGLTHDPTGFGYSVNSCNIITGCEAFYDTIYTNNWTGPFSPGTLTWAIEWKYGFSASDPIQSYVLFTYGVHSTVVNSKGTATISKAGSGSFTKEVSNSTSGSPVDPCIYPVVNP
jgi:hypothetical protein